MQTPNPDRPYDFLGLDALHTYLTTESDKLVSDAVLAWVLRVAKEHGEVESIPIPGQLLGDVCANVPGTDVWVTWLTLHEQRRIWLIDIGKPQDLLSDDEEGDDDDWGIEDDE